MLKYLLLILMLYCGSLIYLISPIAFIGVLLLSIFIILLIVKPGWASFLVILGASSLIPINRFPRLPLLGGGLSIVDLCLVVIASVSVLNFLNYKCIEKKTSKIFFPLLVFFLVAIMQVIRPLLFDEVYQMKRVFNEFRPFLYLFLSFIIFSISAVSKNSLIRLTKVTILISIFVAATQILEATFGIGIFSSRSIGDPLDDGAGYWIKRATVMGMVFVSFSFFYLISDYLSNPKRKFAIVVIVFLFVSILFSLGRMMFISNVLGIIFLFFFLKNNEKPRYLVTWGIMATIMMPIFFLSNSKLNVIGQRFESVFKADTYEGSSLEWRYRENRDALEKVKLNLLMGIGLGQNYRSDRMGREGFPGAFSYIHNGYLFILLKLGLLGLMVFVWMSTVFFKTASANIQSSDEFTRNFARAAIVNFIVLLTMFFTQPEIYNLASMVLISLMFFINDKLYCYERTM